MSEKKYADPITGDPLTRSEHITRVIQDHVIRTWWFLGFFTLTTLFAIGETVFVVKAHPAPMDWWNVWASWAAVIVEGLIGRYMTGQTRRDALIVREIRELVHEVKELTKIDAGHSKADYDIDLDSNQKLEDVLDALAELQEQFDPYKESSYYSEELDASYLDEYYGKPQ